MADATISPLLWPGGVQRTVRPIAGRHRQRIRAVVADVLASIDLLGTITALSASDVVLSFDQDARRREALDGGAAAWFCWDAAQRCVACDLYTTPGANLFAIGQLIRGCVAEHDRGSIAAVRHALANYTPRIPDPTAPSAAGHWTQTLGIEFDASPVEVTAAFRRRALEVHPDKGGTRMEWDFLMVALQQARRATATPRFAPDEWELASLGGDEEIWSILSPNTISENVTKNPRSDHGEPPI